MLSKEKDKAKKCIILYVRARKHTPKKMDKYALFFNKKKFDYVCYNPFLGYSPNSFFSQPQKEKRKKK